MTTSSALNNIFAWYPGTQQDASLTPASCGGSGDPRGVLQIYATHDVELSLGGGPYASELERCGETPADQCGSCMDPADWVGDLTHHVSWSFWGRLKAQIEVLFRPSDGPAPDIPDPTQIMARLWIPNDRLTQTYACHYWRSGVKWWELYVEALEPAPGLHFVGDTFAFNSGWSEAALETAEYMLQEAMGLGRPAWLTKDDYCRAMPYYGPPRRNA